MTKVKILIFYERNLKMKKNILLLIFAWLILSAAMYTCTSATDEESEKSEEISVYLKGNKINFDVQAQTINDRTMVPIRAIFEAMGATVKWDDISQTATCQKDNTTVKMTLDSETEYINGTAVKMDVAPISIDNRTLAPARYVAEAFGYTVNWEEETKSVLINKELLNGEEFTKGDFIVLDNTKITYNGENFIVENNNDKDIIITCSFYGKKKNGTYELIGTPAFYGIDKTQYKKDKEENGWAIEKTTNRVRANEKLVMEMELFDFGAVIEDFSWDIDKDGYYDISFTISKQHDPDKITVSTNDKESEYYKLKAK